MTAEAKSKFATGKSFPVKACDAIRHHLGMIKSLESKRINAFKDRDAALIDKRAAVLDKDSDEYKGACTRHSDAIDLIDSSKRQKAWHDKQIDDLVDNADDANKFDFMYDPPPEVIAPPIKAAAGEPEEDEDEELPEPDHRPVGRIAPKGTASPTAPPVRPFDHVEIDKLDVSERAKAALRREGLTTVGHLSIESLKAKFGSGRLTSIGGITPGDEQDLAKAIQELEAKWKAEPQASPAVETAEAPAPAEAAKSNGRKKRTASAG